MINEKATVYTPPSGPTIHICTICGKGMGYHHRIRIGAVPIINWGANLYCEMPNLSNEMIGEIKSIEIVVL